MLLTEARAGGYTGTATMLRTGARPGRSPRRRTDATAQNKCILMAATIGRRDQTKPTQIQIKHALTDESVTDRQTDR